MDFWIGGLERKGAATKTEARENHRDAMSAELAFGYFSAVLRAPRLQMLLENPGGRMQFCATAD